MADEVNTVDTGTVDQTADTTDVTTGESLLDLEVDTTDTTDTTDTADATDETDITDETDTTDDDKFDSKEIIEKFGDILPDGILGEIIDDFNEGKITGKQAVSDLLNEIGSEKDELNAKIDNEIQTVAKNLKEKPIEGVDLKDLGGWVSKQGQEMVDIAKNLTDFSLGEDAVRSAIALLNKVRMGSGTGSVGDPDIKIAKNTSTTRESLVEEYMDIFNTKDGMERTIGFKGLVKKAEKTGDKELIQFIKEFIM